MPKPNPPNDEEVTDIASGGRNGTGLKIARLPDGSYQEVPVDASTLWQPHLVGYGSSARDGTGLLY